MVTWVIIILIGLFILKQMIPPKGVTNITVPETKTKLKDKDTQFIDVRTPGEFKSNHQSSFKNIPLGDLTKKSTALDKNKETVLICQSGMRSMRAAKLLKKQGFNKLYNVKGGMRAWD